MSEKYIDILISDDDIALDEDNQALQVADIDSITQDLKHMIRESGFLVEMIAERSAEQRELYLIKIILLAESDERIIPGTVKIVASEANFKAKKGVWTLQGDTYEFGVFNLQLGS